MHFNVVGVVIINVVTLALIHVQVGGSGKNKVPKTEEIQSFEYKSRVEIDGVSEWEEEAQRSATAETDHDTNSK